MKSVIVISTCVLTVLCAPPAIPQEYPGSTTYQNGSYLPKWPIFTKMAAVNVCLIFCYFFQMLQFGFTCVQPASSARMSIQNGATTDPYIAWRSALIQ